MLNNHVLKMDNEQKKLAERHYYLAEETVNKCFTFTNGYLTYKYSKDDAIEDAMYALCIAAVKYDKNHESGAQFPTFARCVIKQHIMRKIYKHKKYSAEVLLEDFLNDNRAINIFEEKNEVIDKEIFQVIHQRKHLVEADCPFAYDILILHYYYGMVMKKVAKKYNICEKTAYLKMNVAKNDIMTQLSYVA